MLGFFLHVTHLKKRELFLLFLFFHIFSVCLVKDQIIAGRFPSAWGRWGELQVTQGSGCFLERSAVWHSIRIQPHVSVQMKTSLPIQEPAAVNQQSRTGSANARVTQDKKWLSMNQGGLRGTFFKQKPHGSISGQSTLAPEEETSKKICLLRTLFVQTTWDKSYRIHQIFISSITVNRLSVYVTDISNFFFFWQISILFPSPSPVWSKRGCNK